MKTPLLLRRHGLACAAKHPVDSYSTEAEERRHNWKKCTCRIYAHGTLNGRFKRLATRARDWEFAKEIVAPYIAAGRWDITPSDPPPLPPTAGPDASPPPAKTSGLTVADAVKACLKELENCQSADNTIKAYREILGLFARFAEEHGLRYINQWDRSWVGQLRAQWQAKGNVQITVRKKTKILKLFFEPYVEGGILPENPAGGFKVKHPNRAYRLREGTNSKQKNPYIDEELQRMLAGCAALRPRNSRRVVLINQQRNCLNQWTGEDLADFIELSVFTGLRISDVATFHISRLLDSGEVKLRATKNGNWILVKIPEWLEAVIRSRAQRFGPYIFGEHRTTSLNVISEGWRKKLNYLWAATGPWAEKPTPHRFRHTFVRVLLEAEPEVSISRIAELAGDTEQMIRRHYSAWMPKRQAETSRILAEAFRNMPRFHRG